MGTVLDAPVVEPQQIRGSKQPRPLLFPLELLHRLRVDEPPELGFDGPDALVLYHPGRRWDYFL
jgi:hypothetical protein